MQRKLTTLIDRNSLVPFRCRLFRCCSAFQAGNPPPLTSTALVGKSRIPSLDTLPEPVEAHTPGFLEEFSLLGPIKLQQVESAVS
jgi:hypothetical protein